ncbi:MAG: hypothetical protein WCY19_01870 [Candidatus Gastranaerophilaceae bacterium]
MNIFKTFEIFLREPLSILKERFIQIVNINSGMVTQASVNVDLLEQKTQITVVNSEKMYNLLQTVLYKRKVRAVQQLPPPRQQGQIVIGQLLKRM